MVMASYLVRPGDFRRLLGSPPSRCSKTSVVRFSAVTLLTPATYFPFHFTRNLKFLYGSQRCALTVNCAMFASIALCRSYADDLLDLDDDEFGRTQRRKADDNIDAALVLVERSGAVLVAFYE